MKLPKNGQWYTNKEEKDMKTYYFTIVGTQYRYGHEFLEPDMKVELVKEPDNEVDPEAIKVMIMKSIRIICSSLEHI